jgi:hypothetical protein
MSRWSMFVAGRAVAGSLALVWSTEAQNSRTTGSVRHSDQPWLRDLVAVPVQQPRLLTDEEASRPNEDALRRDRRERAVFECVLRNAPRMAGVADPQGMLLGMCSKYPDLRAGWF